MRLGSAAARERYHFDSSASEPEAAFCLLHFVQPSSGEPNRLKPDFFSAGCLSAEAALALAADESWYFVCCKPPGIGVFESGTPWAPGCCGAASVGAGGWPP